MTLRQLTNEWARWRMAVYGAYVLNWLDRSTANYFMDRLDYHAREMIGEERLEQTL